MSYEIDSEIDDFSPYTSKIAHFLKNVIFKFWDFFTIFLPFFRFEQKIELSTLSAI